LTEIVRQPKIGKDSAAGRRAVLPVKYHTSNQLRFYGVSR